MEVVDEASARQGRRMAGAFIVSFTTLVALFLASSAYVWHRVRAVDDAAASIAENASPSVAHLAGARAALAEVLAELDSYLTAAALHEPATTGALGHARRRLDADIGAYLALPPYPGERELWRGVAQSLAAVDAVIDATVADVQRGQLAAARARDTGELRPAADHAAAMILRVIAFNAARAQALAGAISRTRAEGHRLDLALEAVSTLLAVAIAWRALRAVRQYEALQRAYRRIADERADEQGQFASRVAHDIRSPLAAVRLALQTVERDPAVAERLGPVLARGDRALDRVVRLVDGLLDFARAGARPQPGASADVRAVIDDLVTEMRSDAEAAGIELRADAPAPGPRVACSEGVLTSALANLMRNALKYVANSPVRRVTVRVRERGSRVRCEVEDTGPGLPDALRGRVFEPYVRASGLTQPGLGLGLATVKRLCEAHGGAVGESPPPGGGSLFWFELPRAPRGPAG